MMWHETLHQDLKALSDNVGTFEDRDMITDLVLKDIVNDIDYTLKLAEQPLTFTDGSGHRKYIKKIDVTEYCLTWCNHCKEIQPVEFLTYKLNLDIVTMYCTECNTVILFLNKNKELGK